MSEGTLKTYCWMYSSFNIPAAYEGKCARKRPAVAKPLEDASEKEGETAARTAATPKPAAAKARGGGQTPGSRGAAAALKRPAAAVSPDTPGTPLPQARLLQSVGGGRGGEFGEGEDRREQVGPQVA